MNKLCQQLHIQYPIIQAGMVWVSGAKLAAACANEGILGTIGAGSMKPDLLKLHIEKAFSLCQSEDAKKRIAVNFPLLYQDIEKQITVALDAGVKTFITSAGSPKKFTNFLKKHKCQVLHVVSSPLLAKKCEDAGVDAVIAEGFEAGGHNGRDEITTMVLIPEVVDTVQIPVIAAGGICDHRQIKAAFCLGASAVQMGSRFAATVESSAHDNFKRAILDAQFSSTKLMMKNHVPVRLLDNKFSRAVEKLEDQCADRDQLVQFLGKGRAKKGMLEGDLDNGELEIGQVSGMINDLPSCRELIKRLVQECGF